MEGLLPIGSVVLLKESTKRVMIAGVLQKQANTDKTWDYSGCLYPEGILNPKEMFLFDHEQIETLFFVGFQDEEGIRFTQQASEYLKQNKQNNQNNQNKQ